VVSKSAIRILERLMSFDRRVSFHRTLGFLGILTVSLHPILILGTYAAEQIPLVVTSPRCVSPLHSSSRIGDPVQERARFVVRGDTELETILCRDLTTRLGRAHRVFDTWEGGVSASGGFFRHLLPLWSSCPHQIDTEVPDREGYAEKEDPRGAVCFPPL
jgi:hypothetical protein